VLYSITYPKVARQTSYSKTTTRFFRANLTNEKVNSLLLY
jgi:hypothetical protein